MLWQTGDALQMQSRTLYFVVYYILLASLLFILTLNILATCSRQLNFHIPLDEEIANAHHWHFDALALR